MDVAWCKVWRDLWLNKARTALVVLSIAVDVFAIGVIVGACGIMCACMEEDRQAWVPIHVSFWGWFRRAAAKDAALRDPDVVEVERFIDTTLRWRLKGETDWHDGNLYVRENYEDMRFGLLDLVEEDWPEKRVLAVERLSANYFDIPIGTIVIIQIGQREHRLNVGGVVRDPAVTKTTQPFFRSLCAVAYFKFSGGTRRGLGKQPRFPGSRCLARRCTIYAARSGKGVHANGALRAIASGVNGTAKAGCCCSWMAIRTTGWKGTGHA